MKLYAVTRVYLTPKVNSINVSITWSTQPGIRIPTQRVNSLVSLVTGWVGGLGWVVGLGGWVKQMCCPGAIFFGAGISLRLGKELFLPSRFNSKNGWEHSRYKLQRWRSSFPNTTIQSGNGQSTSTYYVFDDFPTKTFHLLGIFQLPGWHRRVGMKIEASPSHQPASTKSVRFGDVSNSRPHTHTLNVTIYIYITKYIYIYIICITIFHVIVLPEKS